MVGSDSDVSIKSINSNVQTHYSSFDLRTAFDFDAPLIFVLPACQYLDLPADEELERPAFLEPAAIPSARPAAPAESVIPAPDYDAFAHRPPFRPRRNTSKRWTVIAVLAGLLMIAGVGAILFLGAPGLLAKIGLPIGAQESPLRLKDNPIERRELENGSELFAVSGQISNPSGERQRVPDIRAELRDAQGRIVYSWTITPQQRTLNPGGTIDFNSAKLDVPSNSKRLELSFAGEAAN